MSTKKKENEVFHPNLKSITFFNMTKLYFSTVDLIKQLLKFFETFTCKHFLKQIFVFDIPYAMQDVYPR